MFYLTTEPMLSPELRAALLRAFTGLDGLTVSEVGIDGRRLVWIQQPGYEFDYGFLFDPDTGKAVGRRDVITQAGATVDWPSGSPADAQNVGYQVLWTHAIVDAAGETG